MEGEEEVVAAVDMRVSEVAPVAADAQAAFDIGMADDELVVEFFVFGPSWLVPLFSSFSFSRQ